MVSAAGSKILRMSSKFVWTDASKEQKAGPDEIEARLLVERECHAWSGIHEKGQWFMPENVKCLRTAAQYGGAKDIQKYSAGATVSAQEEALSLALRRPNAQVVSAILEAFGPGNGGSLTAGGSHHDPVSGSAAPFLHIAVEGADLECMNMILRRLEVDPGQIRDGDGRTAMHLAAQLGRIMIMKHLLAHGGDARAQDKAGQTPLHYAALAGGCGVLSFLLNNGADPSLPNHKGILPAHLAAHAGNVRGLAELRALRVGLDEECGRGGTPLMYAQSAKRVEVCTYITAQTTGWRSWPERFFRLTWLARLTPVPTVLVARTVWWVTTVASLLGFFLWPFPVAILTLTVFLGADYAVVLYRGEDRPAYLRHRPTAHTWWDLVFFYQLLFSVFSVQVYIREWYASPRLWSDPLCWALLPLTAAHYFNEYQVRAGKPDPGRVPHRPDDIHQLLGWVAGSKSLSSFCASCWVVRPERAKHCRECGICVERMDHHCVILSGCVGKGNHGLFTMFLTVFCLLYMVAIRNLLMIILPNVVDRPYADYGEAHPEVCLVWVLLAGNAARDLVLCWEQWTRMGMLNTTGNEHKNQKRYFKADQNGKYVNPHFVSVARHFTDFRREVGRALWAPEYPPWARAALGLTVVLMVLSKDLAVCAVLFVLLLGFHPNRPEMDAWWSRALAGPNGAARVNLLAYAFFLSLLGGSLYDPLSVYMGWVEV